MGSSLLPQDAATTFARRGFVAGNELLDAKTSSALFNLIDDIVKREENPYHKRVYNFGHGGRPLLHIKNMWKRYGEFNDLHSNPALLGALRELTGVRRFRLWQDRFFYKPASVGGYHTWHQDMTFLPFLPPFTAVSAWVALTDADEDNGAMYMVEGSHKWGDASEFLNEVADYAGERRPLPPTYGGENVTISPCPVPQGHVHFHDCRTWHSSGPNWSDRTRCAIGMFFVDADVLFDGNNKWAKDYVGVHGAHLDSEAYPLVERDGD